jgi:Ricin-type beta-trefoil lectin domain
MNKVICMAAALLSAAICLSSCATPRQISSGDTNTCMNVISHGYPVAGTQLNVKPCDPWRNQQWTLNKGQITGLGGFCVDVQGSQPAEGAPVVYVPCTGGPSQNWTVANNQIVGIGGKCMDTVNSTDNPPQVIIATCSGSPSQVWLWH